MRTPGTITLALRRHRAPVGESKDAVIALAGGPGQSAIPFIGEFGQILGPIASTRDVIAFDQRGTGLSHPLSCPAFEHLRGGGSPTAVAICAGQIGETRGLYTTADTVADIEAIRQAGGYEKLVLVRDLVRDEGGRALRPELSEPRGGARARLGRAPIGAGTVRRDELRGGGACPEAALRGRGVLAHHVRTRWTTSRGSSGGWGVAG